MWQFRTVSLTFFAILSIFSIIGVLLAISFLVFNVKFRKMRLVKMSSPNLNVLIALGGLLSYCCCSMLGAEAFLGKDLASTAIVCQIRTWLMTLALTLVFGTTMAKSWRVYRIFKATGSQRVVIKDEKLVAIVAGLVCVDVVILSFWHGLDPLTAHLVHVGFLENDLSEFFNATPVVVTSCSSGNIQIWLCILFLYKTTLLISGLYLAWVTRNVVLPAINESKFTILGTFITTILCSVGAALSVVLRSSPDVSCGCLAIAVWISATTCLLLMFIPKIRFVKKAKDKVFIRQSVKLTPSQEMPPSQENLQREMYQLMSENVLLKSSLSEKDVAIRSLQEHLDSAKAKLQQLSEETEVKNDSGLDVDLSSSVSSQEDDSAGGQVDDKIEDIPGKSLRSDFGDVPESPRTDVITPVSKLGSVTRREAFRTPADKLDVSVLRSGMLRDDTARGSSRNRLAALRDSIAEDLQHAHSFTSNLRDSISKDLDQISFQESARNLMCAGSRKGLAVSVAESYNFGQEGDDWSYINQLLRTQRPVKSKPVYSRSREESTKTARSFTTPVAPSVLSSDELYPESVQATMVRSCRLPNSRNNKAGHLVSDTRVIPSTAPSKSRIRGSVYVIHNQQTKHIVTSCVAQKQCLKTTDGTYFEVLDSFV